MLTASFGVYGIRGEDLLVRYEGGKVGVSEHGTPGLRDRAYMWVSATAFSRVQLRDYIPHPDLERFAACFQAGDLKGMSAARAALADGLRVLSYNECRLDDALRRLMPPPGIPAAGPLLAPRREPFLPRPGGFIYVTGSHGSLVLVPTDGLPGTPGSLAWGVAPLRRQEFLLGHVTDRRAGPGVPPSLVPPEDPGEAPYEARGPSQRGAVIACHSLPGAMAGVFRLWKAAGQPRPAAPETRESLPAGPVRLAVPPPGSWPMPGTEVAGKWLERDSDEAGMLVGTLFGAGAVEDASRIHGGSTWTSPPYQGTDGPRFLVLTPWPLSLVRATIHKAVVGVPAAAHLPVASGAAHRPCYGGEPGPRGLPGRQGGQERGNLQPAMTLLEPWPGPRRR